ncbi:MAG: alanine--tRNA ligase [archaeon]
MMQPGNLMPSDKEVKKEFKLKASQDPDKYYATSVLKSHGFMRKRCSCGTFFWSTIPDRKVCGDPSCSGGFGFFKDTPAKKEMDYIQVWQEFAAMFKGLGYTPIKRYPVIARWREDTDFVQASIYGFQPYVVSGEVEPPANPLVIPQFSLRFNDIDNVGITGSHYTGFVMIGQHAFMRPDQWDQDRFFSDIHTWLNKGLGLPNDEIIFHEDAWAGGGNFGPCMEYFSRGLELGNQVYMLYEQTPSGPKELPIKVLDMGMGHERNAWFTKGTSTSYETTFPTVCKELYKRTGVSPDSDLMRRFLPYSSYLNADEVEDLGKEWQRVAKEIGVGTKELKEHILPLAGLYSVADHARTLLFALSDGGLPSNTGGGYNLRVILRRALAFIDKFKWDIDLPTVCRWHADYLKPIFPELSENLENVQKILDEEKRKFLATKEKSHQIIAKIINENEDIDEERLLRLYDSQGVAPELIAEEAEKLGKTVKVPDDFYAKVAELHEQGEQEYATVREEKLPLEGLPDTEGLYFGDYTVGENRARVLKIIGEDVVLDKTVAYPTSGGQLHDHATIAGQETADIFKQGGIIVHRLKEKPVFVEGDEVTVTIDPDWRRQLAQHHTATHIVNAAAKKVLGNHINQAGAKKTHEKATLDITHYKSVSDEELKQIEEEANRMVEADYPIAKDFLLRADAEKKYGMRIYQGGAVPGKHLRIVAIGDVDIEACGGTHLNRTGETGHITMIKSGKISDSIVRLTYTAGKASEQKAGEQEGIAKEAADLLGCSEKQIPSRAAELFNKWKAAKKAKKKRQPVPEDVFSLSSSEETVGDPVAETAKALKTQTEHIVKTITRFKAEIEALR